MEIVFNGQKERADANQESSPRTHQEINIREVRTPSQIVFTQENIVLFVQQAVQYSQDLEGEDLHYHVIGLNESSTEDDLKNSIIN